MLTLLIKASLVIIVLLAFYKLFLEKESFFAANRVYLLGCLLFAAILPFVGLPKLMEHQGYVASFLQTSQPDAMGSDEAATVPAGKPDDARQTKTLEPTELGPENANTSTMPLHSATPSVSGSPLQTERNVIPEAHQTANRGVTHWLLLLYCFGVIVLAFKLLVQIVDTVWKIYKNDDKVVDEDNVLINMQGDIDPCSFFHYIFINPAGYDYETYEHILAHEQIHVRQWHTLDLLLSEIAVIALWFNPFVWMLRKEVEKNIEYQTDDLMVRKNAAARESYQLNLVKIATYTYPLTITTNYNQSLIKNRILKMNAKKSNRYSYLKYAFLLPTLFGLSLLLNEPARGNDRLPANAAGLLDEPSESSISKDKQFYTTQDTLILKPEKYPGYGLFRGGFGVLHVAPIGENDERRTQIPAGITDPEFGQEYFDFKVYHYRNLKKNHREYLSSFLKESYPEKIDTANLPSEADNTLKVLVGKRDGKKIYIVDQNNNLDFRDDPVRPLKKISETNMEEPVRCHYRIYNGQTIVSDSSWVYIGTMSNGEVGFSAAQHLRSTFSVDDQAYSIRVFNSVPSMRWCFENPLISITTQNGITKDSLGFGDHLELGEFLKFGKYYYRFADIANDGSTITLIREKDIQDDTGIQVGLMAPDFKVVTLDGTPIALSDYRGRYLLLVNVAGMCWSQAYRHYEDLYAHYRDKIAVVGIEGSSRDFQHYTKGRNLEGPFIMSQDHPDFERSYRDYHCSRVCYLIEPSGRIIDRFEVTDWKNSLARHFD